MAATDKTYRFMVFSNRRTGENLYNLFPPVYQRNQPLRLDYFLGRDSGGTIPLIR